MCLRVCVYVRVCVCACVYTPDRVGAYVCDMCVRVWYVCVRVCIHARVPMVVPMLEPMLVLVLACTCLCGHTHALVTHAGVRACIHSEDSVTTP